MSNDSPDLPVAAKFGDGGEFVKKSDAEEAIKEARRQERREILEKIKDKITRWSERIESHEDVPSPLKIRKSVLEELRDDLEESEEGGSRDD